MLKKVQVCMLPTNKDAAFFTNKKYPELFQIGDNTVDNPKWQGQHLYFTSDEEIKDNDWYIAPDNKVYQALCRKSNLFKNIVATTNRRLCHLGEHCYTYGTHICKRLPNISSDFIKKYVEEDGNIKEVELEYESYNHRFSKDHGGNISVVDWRLKLYPDSTVIIHNIKEKMYTRGEVLDILKAWDDYRAPILDTPLIRKEWFNKNYPK